MSRAISSRQILQIVIAVGALVPFLTGIIGVLQGFGMFGSDADTVDLSIDSHYRYLCGILMGIGICFWSIIPDIERKKVQFQLLTTLVFIGGLGRLYAVVRVGVPNGAMLFGLCMELIVTPLLAWWQSKIARI